MFQWGLVRSMAERQTQQLCNKCLFLHNTWFYNFVEFPRTFISISRNLVAKWFRWTQAWFTAVHTPTHFKYIHAGGHEHMYMLQEVNNCYDSLSWRAVLVVVAAVEKNSRAKSWSYIKYPHHSGTWNRHMGHDTWHTVCDYLLLSLWHTLFWTAC